MAIYPNPENALKRAEEALLVLHDVVTSRNFRSWKKEHENIMFRFVELCVELRKGTFAKDGLILYRNSCQQVNLKSFEEVTRHFLWLVTEKAENAEALDEEEEALDVDKDFIIVRSEVVTPWLEFSFEAYRIVLEILRNNSKLEALYVMTAHEAFRFCKQYKRTTEFRKLCELIRNHLANLIKYKDQRDQPDLTVPETLEFHLNTRFEQLRVATELGLWQEGFRTVEDIYGLMCMVKKMPKPYFFLVYYSKLTEIFWMSSSHLYHAYAWFKLYSFYSLQKVFSDNSYQKDMQLIASSVVLATLSVPLSGCAHGASHLELEYEKEDNMKMANLIGFNLEPELEGIDKISREWLLSMLASSGVLSSANQEVKDLYHLMEQESQPLDLGSTVQPLLDRISKLSSKLSSLSPSLPEVQLSKYVPSLEKLATLKLLQEVSKMYETIKITHLAQMIPFFDFSVVEKISFDAVKNNLFAMKVDHAKGVVVFGNPVVESDCLRSPLAIFAETLNKVRAMLFPASNKGDMVPNLEEAVDEEHKRLLARKSIIHKRKVEKEHQRLEMEFEKEMIKRKLNEEAEQKRLAIEVEEIRRQPTFIEKVSKQTVFEKALSKKFKENQEKEKKLEKLFKTMDYIERAKREEAVPLIEAAYQQRLVEEKEVYESEAELSRKRYERDLIERHRLVKMSDNKEIYQERVFNLRLAAGEEQVAQIIQARRQEREIQRKKIYYLILEEERRRFLLS